MNKDYESNTWFENHARIGEWAASTVASIGIALERLNARQYDAPWRREAAVHTCPQ